MPAGSSVSASASLTAADVRQNIEFQHGDAGKFDHVILFLTDGSRRAEAPLLAHDFLKGTTAVRRPAQNELLCAADFGFLEDQRRWKGPRCQLLTFLR